MRVLHEALADRLRALDFPVEQRRFRPHLTLARHALAAVAPEAPAVPFEWPARSYVLAASTGHPDRRYAVLRGYGDIGREGGTPGRHDPCHSRGLACNTGGSKMNKDSKQPDHGENQGEGNRDAARRYNEDQKQFVQSGKVADAARRAAGQDPGEAKKAEQAGRDHAKEFDPEESRDYSKPDQG
jgi:hypothetical protein